MSEKGLPYSLAAERTLLARIIEDSSLHVQVASLKPEDFGYELHRRILIAYRDILASGEDPNYVTVCTLMGSRGQNDGNLLSYLVDLSVGCVSIPNLEGVARVIQDKAALRSIALIGQQLVNQALNETSSPDEILATTKDSLLELAQDRRQTSLETPGEIVQSLGGLQVYLDRRDRKNGVKTGFTLFDVLSGGLKTGKLYVLGARPRMGKTALVLNIAENVAFRFDETVQIFSLEMDKESLVDRLVCSRARVNTKRFEGGWMDESERKRITKAGGEIASSDLIYIDDKATTDMQEIHAKVRKFAATRPVGLVIIDYLQLMLNGNEKYRVAEMSKISRDAKLLAKDCKIPVIGLSQLSRDCDTRNDHRPQLSDLRESGSIEQDADLVAFLYREEVYSPDREDCRGLAELIVAKQRSGPEGTVPLVWLKEIVRFENAAEEYHD